MTKEILRNHPRISKKGKYQKYDILAMLLYPFMAVSVPTAINGGYCVHGSRHH